MALQQNNIVDWTDIENIYTNLNTARTKFNFSTVTIPDEQENKPIPSHISSLKDLIQNMTSNTWLTSIASTSGVSVPSTSDLLEPTAFNQLSTIVNNMNNTCIHFGSNYGYDAADFGSNYGYDAADFSGNNSWNSGFYGWNSGFYGWNSGFYSF